MPGLNLNEKEAREIAAYFFQGHKVPPNMQFAYFEEAGTTCRISA